MKTKGEIWISELFLCSKRSEKSGQFIIFIIAKCCDEYDRFIGKVTQQTGAEFHAVESLHGHRQRCRIVTLYDDISEFKGSTFMLRHLNRVQFVLRVCILNSDVFCYFIVTLQSFVNMFSVVALMIMKENMVNLVSAVNCWLTKHTLLHELQCTVPLLLAVANTGWSKTEKPRRFCHNFIRYRPVYKLLSRTHSAHNMQ